MDRLWLIYIALVAHLVHKGDVMQQQLICNWFVFMIKCTKIGKMMEFTS